MDRSVTFYSRTRGIGFITILYIIYELVSNRRVGYKRGR